MLLPAGWTSFNHRGEAGGLAEAVPIYESVEVAMAGLRSIIEHHEARLKHAQSNRRYQIGQAMFGTALPEWGQTHLFYRGHNSIKYDVLPTLHRLDGDRESTLGQIDRRAKKLTSVLNRLDNLSESADEFTFLKQLTGPQKEALVRHYGCPSTLLDVTASLDVAAHFATRDAGKTAPGDDLGIIYAFNLLDFLNLSGMTSIGPTRNGVGYSFTPIGRVSREVLIFESSSRARWEQFDIYFNEEKPRALSFEFVFVPGVERIDVQQAAFISVGNSIDQSVAEELPEDPLRVVATWEILQMFSYKVSFVHSGNEYTSGLPEGSRAAIYPDDFLTQQLSSIVNDC